MFKRSKQKSVMSDKGDAVVSVVFVGMSNYCTSTRENFKSQNEKNDKRSSPDTGTGTVAKYCVLCL